LQARGEDDRRRGLDQRQVRERLGEVPEMPAGSRVVLLGVQTEWGDNAKQALHEVSRALVLTDDREAETSQNEQIRKLPSLPVSPSSVSA
jgi:hypothetical protein